MQEGTASKAKLLAELKPQCFAAVCATVLLNARLPLLHVPALLLLLPPLPLTV
jgi:hypothetical protein